MDAYLTRLQRQLAEQVPLAQASGVRLAFDPAGAICAEAPFAPNRNMHGTAFGGSLYTVSLVCGFAQTRWLTEQAGLEAEIVVHRAQAEYHRPVRGPLIASIGAAQTQSQHDFLRTLEHRGRARLALDITIDADDQRAFTLQASFAARMPVTAAPPIHSSR